MNIEEKYKTEATIFDNDNKQRKIILYFQGFVLVKYLINGDKLIDKKRWNILINENKINFNDFLYKFYMPLRKEHFDENSYLLFDDYFENDFFKSNNLLEKGEKFTQGELLLVCYLYEWNNKSQKTSGYESKMKWIYVWNIYLINFGTKRTIKSFERKISNLIYCTSNGKKGFKNDTKITVSGEKVPETFHMYDKILFKSLEQMEIMIWNNLNIDFKSFFLNTKNEKYVENKKVKREITVRDSYSQKIWKDKLINNRNEIKCDISNCYIKIKDLLIASHIKEWSKCDESESFAIKNGLLLCPNHDSLFDKKIITFNSDGRIMLNKLILKETDYISLNIDNDSTISKSFFDEVYMQYHRKIWNK